MSQKKYGKAVLLRQALTKLKQWQIFVPKTSKQKALTQALPDIIN
ncbi:MAG: hypothetical protein PUP93_31345 [Rhizonema sp. NSF051]|nr:hypothetical protein [Rhizonema sp. NSF051]